MARHGKNSHDKVAQTMHELKEGRLRSSTDRKVTDPKQAIAIGLSQARREGSQVPGRPVAAKSPAKKAGANEAPAKKTTAGKIPATKASARTAAAKTVRAKTPAKKVPTKRAAAKRTRTTAGGAEKATSR